MQGNHEPHQEIIPGGRESRPQACQRCSSTRDTSFVPGAQPSQELTCRPGSTLGQVHRPVLRRRCCIPHTNQRRRPLQGDVLPQMVQSSGMDGRFRSRDARLPPLSFTEVDGVTGELQKATAVGSGGAGTQLVQRRDGIRQHHVERTVADGRGDEGNEVAVGGDQVARPSVHTDHLQRKRPPHKPFCQRAGDGPGTPQCVVHEISSREFEQHLILGFVHELPEPALSQGGRASFVVGHVDRSPQIQTLNFYLLDVSQF